MQTLEVDAIPAPAMDLYLEEFKKESKAAAEVTKLIFTSTTDKADKFRKNKVIAKH
jgi:hypothetical protein